MNKFFIKTFIFFIIIMSFTNAQMKKKHKNHDDSKNISIKSIEDLDNFLTKETIDNNFSGTILIAKNGKPIFTKEFGLASRRYNIPNKIDTKLNLGSMNKMFTSIAIAQLVEKGKLSFDDKIVNVWQNYPNKEIAEKVTIHHLLTHTSGLGIYWDPLSNLAISKYKQLKELQQTFDAVIADEKLQFTPGERFSYSNSGYVVLGIIIEKVTGQSYYDYVKENIFEPAGMINTDYYEIDSPVPNLATGYYKTAEGKIVNNIFDSTIKGVSAGGGYSTVEDMLKFSDALWNYKILSKKYVDIITTSKISTKMGGYGYGFMDRPLNGYKINGHNGGAPGINAFFFTFPEIHFTWTLLSNYSNINLRELSSEIDNLVTNILAKEE